MIRRWRERRKRRARERPAGAHGVMVLPHVGTTGRFDTSFTASIPTMVNRGSQRDSAASEDPA